ncbi:MAG: STAS domain-containing protein [Phycisphaeraceae bacterium]
MLSELVDVEQAGAVVTVRVRTPELAHDQMQQLVVECLERMRCHHAYHFVFDLSQVTFLASACVGALVELLREVEPVRGRIVMVGCQESVAFMLQVTRLEQVFPMFDDENEAIAALRHSG